jgi:hypothetical protein
MLAGEPGAPHALIVECDSHSGSNLQLLGHL